MTLKYRIDRFLIALPDSTTSWHCPWFRLILFFAINAVVFGFWSYIQFEVWLGIAAAVLGFIAGAFTLGSRSRGGHTC